MALNKTSTCLTTAGLLACIFVAACDVPPAAPKTLEGERMEVLNISPADRDELGVATAAEAARVNYRYRLAVLQAYYEKVGNIDKLIWARREMKNLDDSQTFQWSGLPAVTPPKGESLENADERVLVEYVVTARNRYFEATSELADFYQRGGENFKACLIINTQDRLDPVRTYMYFLSAEIPPADLKPVSMIPDADTLFAEAIRLHNRGKGILHIALTTSYPKQRQALMKFLELINTYPSSNKIALSAYYIGEIYKEYFNEDIRAVHWYQRAWQWDPQITKPARFQAATVHDIRLHNYSQAVECYRQAVKYEQFNATNVIFARRRIREMTGQ